MIIIFYYFLLSFTSGEDNLNVNNRKVSISAPTEAELRSQKTINDEYENCRKRAYGSNAGKKSCQNIRSKRQVENAERYKKIDDSPGTLPLPINKSESSK